MILRERDLEIDFTDAMHGVVFDQMDETQPDYHGISQMHRVDFVVEFMENIVFVEVKDPGNSRARAEGINSFLGELNDGTLSTTFASKFIDTFLYRWAEDLTHKPIHFLNLVTLDPELLPNLSDEIVRKIPPLGIAVPRWRRQLFYNCQVFNIETWNDNFPRWPARRLSNVN